MWKIIQGWCSNCARLHENPRSQLVPFCTLCPNLGQCSGQTGRMLLFLTLWDVLGHPGFKGNTSQTSMCTQITWDLIKKQILIHSILSGSKYSQVKLLLLAPTPCVGAVRSKARTLWQQPSCLSLWVEQGSGRNNSVFPIQLVFFFFFFPPRK